MFHWKVFYEIQSTWRSGLLEPEIWCIGVPRETVEVQHPQFDNGLNLGVMSPEEKLFLTWWRHKWEEMPALCL